MDRVKKDSPQRTQRGAERCYFSLRASALSAVFGIVPVNNKKSQFYCDTDKISLKIVMLRGYHIHAVVAGRFADRRGSCAMRPPG